MHCGALDGKAKQNAVKLDAYFEVILRIAYVPNGWRDFFSGSFHTQQVTP
jgi:hypothetical protein